MYEHLNMMTSRFIIDDRYLLSFSIGIIIDCLPVLKKKKVLLGTDSKKPGIFNAFYTVIYILQEKMAKNYGVNLL